MLLLALSFLFVLSLKVHVYSDPLNSFHLNPRLLAATLGRRRFLSNFRQLCWYFTPSFLQLFSVTLLKYFQGPHVLSTLPCKSKWERYAKQWDCITSSVMFPISALFLNCALAPPRVICLFSLLQSNLLLFQIWWRILMKHPRMRLTRGNGTSRSVKNLTGPCGQKMFSCLLWEVES